MIKAALLISGGKDKLVIKWHQDKWLSGKSINPTSHTHIPRWMKDINMYLIGILEEEDRENTKKKKKIRENGCFYPKLKDRSP